MTAIRLPADRIFFEEWSRSHATSRRSIPRAAMLARAMGVALHAVPTIVVVGSKGKATAATTASAALANAGHRVGTITSPPIVTNRERMRVDGAAIGEREYEELARRVEAALRRGAGPAGGDAGAPYLSPAGAYLIAGLDHFARSGCDVHVIEAGMGGRSDEVSLLEPDVLLVTAIFLEHAGILGNTIEEIRQEKLGAAAAHTRIVFEDALAAARLIDPHASLDGVTLHLPGRMTTHRDAEGRTWVVDAAIHADGIARAVEFAQPDFVLVSLPDGKDIANTASWLDARLPGRWSPVRPRVAEHLTYATWRIEVVPWQPPRARRVLAVGSWSFIAEVLAFLGVENEVAFSVPAKYS